MNVNYLAKLSELIRFIGIGDHAHTDVLRYITRSTLEDLQATCTVITELKDDGALKISGLFGFDKSAFQSTPETLRISDPYPVPEVLRSRKIIWINSLPEWPDEYPKLKAIPYPNNEKTVILIPVERFGVPVACLTFFSVLKIEPDAEIQAFLGAVGSVYSLYLFRYDLESRINEAAESIMNSRIRKPSTNDEPRELSDRQLIILKLISSGLTNIQISDQIGYSESTVRQETVKIFALLGCANRREAGQIYKDVYSEKVAI